MRFRSVIDRHTWKDESWGDVQKRRLIQCLELTGRLFIADGLATEKALEPIRVGSFLYVIQSQSSRIQWVGRFGRWQEFANRELSKNKNNNNNNDCIWYSDPESDSQRELKATYSVHCRPTWEINLYLTPGPGVEPGSSALKASVLPLGHPVSRTEITVYGTHAAISCLFNRLSSWQL